MTVGEAEQLLATVGNEDSVPYNFRTSGGSVDIGDRETDMVVGGTIGWNQLVHIPSDKTKTENGVTITDNRDGTYTVSTDASGASNVVYITFGSLGELIKDHKYLFKSTPSGGSASSYYSYVINVGIVEQKTDFGNGVVVNCLSNGTVNIVIFIAKNAVITTPITFKPVMYDLTQMFGSTIADYIYNLEQANAGAGVAWFKKLFPKDYYAYNTGELMSVKTSAHKMVGFNAWDEEWELGYWSYQQNGAFVQNNSFFACKNKIPVVPNTTYFWQVSSVIREVLFYDAKEDYLARQSYGAIAPSTFTTPSGCHYVTFYCASSYGTTYKNDICINLSWDGERNGEYEPYEEHVYPLDSSLELRGIPKLDSANNLYYDGDTYESDGTVTRKYGIRAFASGDDEDSTVITDGTNTVYLLAEPTTETAEPYQNPQIVNDFGTEEYVDERAVPIPVGHQTKYLANLRAKLEMSPDSPSADGEYILKQTSGKNEYIALGSSTTMQSIMAKLPNPPSEDGTYTLKVTVANGEPTYSWEA